jgi:hypothetical protein
MIFVALCNTACGSRSSGDLDEDINQTITIVAPPQVNSLKANDFIGLVIQNNSDDKIELSYEYGVNIKRMKENQWFDFMTVMDAYLSPTSLSSKSQKEFSFTYIDFILKIEIQEPEVLRFTVMGVNQSTSQEVYAYIDLNLLP